MTKDLKNKAVNIKGKKYVLVSDRVIFFNDEYKNGSIETSYTRTDDTYEFKAVVTPDVAVQARKFIGHSQAVIGDGMVNRTAAMENAETSAVGRALAMMGIGVIESIASADEMNKAIYSGVKPRYITMKQVELAANKVKWGLKIYDKEETIQFLDSVAEQDFSKLTQDKFDEYLTKLDEAIREEKVLNKTAESVEDLKSTDIMVEGEDGERVVTDVY